MDIKHEPVYIVDAEADTNDPVVVKVEVTQVLRDGGNVDPEYLGHLLSDLNAVFGGNMEFAKTEEAALEAAKQWSDQED